MWATQDDFLYLISLFPCQKMLHIYSVGKVWMSVSHCQPDLLMKTDTNVFVSGIVCSLHTVFYETAAVPLLCVHFCQTFINELDNSKGIPFWIMPSSWWLECCSHRLTIYVHKIIVNVHKMPPLRCWVLTNQWSHCKSKKRYAQKVDLKWSNNSKSRSTNFLMHWWRLRK